MTDQQALCPGPGMSSTRVSGKIDRLDQPPANGRTESASTPSNRRVIWGIPAELNGMLPMRAWG